MALQAFLSTWRWLRRVGPALVVLAILAAGWLAVHELQVGGEGTAAEAPPPVAERTSVTLASGKLAAAGLVVEPVREDAIQAIHVVPGRLRYDETRHVDLTAPVDGILAEVCVRPGDRVEAGTVLARIDSPAIGRARSEILRRRAVLDLAVREHDRAAELRKNLADLLAELDQGSSVEDLEARFASRSLGTYRQELLAAYSSLRLARDLSDSLRNLGQSGSVAGRTIRERETDRQIATSAFRSIRDEATFEAAQTERRTAADVADAERNLQTARQEFEILLGGQMVAAPADGEGEISRLEIRAPFAGTIETRPLAETERVARGESVFILADTSTLYVAADLRENDWAAVNLASGQTVGLFVPAQGERRLTATVDYVGREVDPLSRSVPLIATVANPAGDLRPGMFVRVAVPVGPEKRAVVVPPAAVVRHDDERFVFVRAPSADTFVRRDVTAGLESDAWVEITSGLEVGEPVVARGADLLKAELLLEAEE